MPGAEQQRYEPDDSTYMEYQSIDVLEMLGHL